MHNMSLMIDTCVFLACRVGKLPFELGTPQDYTYKFKTSKNTTKLFNFLHFNIKSILACIREYVYFVNDVFVVRSRKTDKNTIYNTINNDIRFND